MLLQYIHIIFLPHDAIYFVQCTRPSCSKAPTQHDADVVRVLSGELDLCGTHLKVSVVVVGVFGLPDLHGHARLLHELTRCQRQTTQHALAAANQHFL